MNPTLEALNHLPQAEFVSRLEGLYEHSPWIVEAIAPERPFATGDALIEAAQARIRQAPHAAQLALVCAHPELGSRQLASLTASSQAEQRGAGLTQDDDTITQLRALNDSYRQRHGFPFVVAVAGLTPDTILTTLKARLPRGSDTELDESLTQIGHIAHARLNKLLSADVA